MKSYLDYDFQVWIHKVDYDFHYGSMKSCLDYDFDYGSSLDYDFVYGSSLDYDFDYMFAPVRRVHETWGSLIW